MGKYLLLLSLVAFGVGFCLSLLVQRNIETALLTGFITVPATFLGVIAVNRKRRKQQKLAATALQAHELELEEWEAQLNQTYLALTAEERRTKTNISFLKTELNQLYAQIAEQRSFKQQLSQDLINFGEHKDKLTAELQDLQTQIYNCEQKRKDIHYSLHTIKSETQNVPDIQAELSQLQMQVVGLQNQKAEIEASVVALKQSKPQLEEKVFNLQTQIQQLQRQEVNLNQSLSALLREKTAAEINCNLRKSQLEQLKTQFIEQQNLKKQLEQQLTTLQQHQPEAEQTIKIPAEWKEFIARLPKYELQVIKAIVEQENPSTTIKTIAEENITMPELLIDFINKRALNTVGDLIIIPGDESHPPKISEEYLTVVKQVVKIKEMN